jgi:hypothetical protein
MLLAGAEAVGVPTTSSRGHALRRGEDEDDVVAAVVRFGHSTFSRLWSGEKWLWELGRFAGVNGPVFVFFG